MRLLNFRLLGLALRLVLGGRVLDPLDAAIAFLERAEVIGALTPPGQPMRQRQFGATADGLANGVIQQIDVGGKVDVGLHHKRVTAGVEPFVRTFFSA